jgi:TPR repeat protein
MTGRLLVCAVLFGAISAAAGATPSHAQSSEAHTQADPRLLDAIDWYTGVAGEVNDAFAKALLEELDAEGEDVLARMWIARVHSTGRMGFSRDESRAREIAATVIDDIQALADDGDVEAVFLMGTAYDEALGVENDYREAMRWYRRAADVGHVLAAHNVGNMYRDGRGVEVDHEAAAEWWIRAARAGDVIPALRLGEAYEAGRGVPLDLEEAVFWYGRAAEAGNAAAAEALARLSG